MFYKLDDSSLTIILLYLDFDSIKKFDKHWQLLWLSAVTNTTIQSNEKRSFFKKSDVFELYLLTNSIRLDYNQCDLSFCHHLEPYSMFVHAISDFPLSNINVQTSSPSNNLDLPLYWSFDIGRRSSDRAESWLFVADNNFSNPSFLTISFSRKKEFCEQFFQTDLLTIVPLSMAEVFNRYLGVDYWNLLRTAQDNYYEDWNNI